MRPSAIGSERQRMHAGVPKIKKEGVRRSSTNACTLGAGLNRIEPDPLVPFRDIHALDEQPQAIS